jgi:hypothetical protein
MLLTGAAIGEAIAAASACVIRPQSELGVPAIVGTGRGTEFRPHATKTIGVRLIGSTQFVGLQVRDDHTHDTGDEIRAG